MVARWIGDLVHRSNSLAWYDVKTEAAKTLLSGKAAIADAKISPDGKWFRLCANTICLR